VSEKDGIIGVLSDGVNTATYCLITYIPTFVVVRYPLYIRPLPFTASNANKYGFRPLRNYGCMKAMTQLIGQKKKLRT